MLALARVCRPAGSILVARACAAHIPALIAAPCGPVASAPLPSLMAGVDARRRLATKAPAPFTVEMPGHYSGRIVKWLKAVGDPVKEHEGLCDVETDVRFRGGRS